MLTTRKKYGILTARPCASYLVATITPIYPFSTTSSFWETIIRFVKDHYLSDAVTKMLIENLPAYSRMFASPLVSSCFRPEFSSYPMFFVSSRYVGVFGRHSPCPARTGGATALAKRLPG